MKTVREGSRGLTVTYAQYALGRAGFDPGTIDGIFGPRTRRAAMAFQSANGLVSDGIIGERTWALLFPYLSGYTLVRVQSGDTFRSIAARYNTSAEAIAVANPLALPENLTVGETLIVPLPFPASTWEAPYSSALNGIVLDGLRARYPNIAVYAIGRSVLGREMLAASFGRGRITVGINAAHHANEWITTPLVLRFLEAYAFAEATNGQIGGYRARDLFSRTRLVLVPLVNPDGVDLVNDLFAANEPPFVRAMGFAGAYPKIPFPSGWKANLNGVDLNLGYPAGWERAKEIKFAAGYTRPGPRDYVGSAPLAEPENRAMYELTRRENFALTVSYHTQGAEIYWRYGKREVAGARRIANAFAAASGYAVADPAEDSGYAGYKDWFIEAFSRPGYTVEAGRGRTPLPLSALPQLYRENVGILANALALAPQA